MSNSQYRRLEDLKAALAPEARVPEAHHHQRDLDSHCAEVLRDTMTFLHRVMRIADQAAQGATAEELTEALETARSDKPNTRRGRVRTIQMGIRAAALIQSTVRMLRPGGKATMKKVARVNDAAAAISSHPGDARPGKA